MVMDDLNPDAFLGIPATRSQLSEEERRARPKAQIGLSTWTRLLVGLVLLACPAREGFAQGGIAVFNDYWVQPEAYSVPESGSVFEVDAKGDLNLSLPLLTVPGRGGLSYDIALSYSSSVQADQAASWAGLGWNFEPGSISRAAHGAIMSNTASGIYGVDNFDVQGHQGYLPDRFSASLPGRGAVTFMALSHSQSHVTLNHPLASSHYPGKPTPDTGFTLVNERPWAIASWKSVVSSQVMNGFTAQTRRFAELGTDSNVQDYDSFVITTDDGVRYVYGLPTLSTFTVGNYAGVTKRKDVYVSAWRLVAILGVNYGGDSLIPSSGQGDPDGPWIQLHYGARSALVSGTTMSRGEGSINEFYYLTCVETPTHYALVNDGTTCNTSAAAAGSASAIAADDAQDYARAIQSPGVLSNITLWRKAAEEQSGVDRKIRRVELGQQHLFNSIVGGQNRPLRPALTSVSFEDSDGAPLPGYQMEYGASNPDPLEILGGGNDPEYNCGLKPYTQTATDGSSTVASRRMVSDCVDDFGFYAGVDANIYSGSSPGSGAVLDMSVLRGTTRSDGVFEPDAAGWSLRRLTYPSGVTESIQYEHDKVGRRHEGGLGGYNDQSILMYPFAEWVASTSHGGGQYERYSGHSHVLFPSRQQGDVHGFSGSTRRGSGWREG